MPKRFHLALQRLPYLIILATGFSACRNPELDTSGSALPYPSSGPTVAVVEVGAPEPVAPTPSATTATLPAVASIPESPTATPFYSGPLSPACGMGLPALPSAPGAQMSLNLSDAARGTLMTSVPPAARPALQRLLDAPTTVGLVAYQVGRETEGASLNANVPMPLASVAKIITLVAYVEAVAAGELNPLELVPLADLDRFYLPNFDLGAHRRALLELEEGGRIVSPEADPAVRLEDVPWMMIRHSSNAAADYLHFRLGQARIEEMTMALGLNDAPNNHSAPCTFLGQFLMMANHTRSSANDRTVLSGYVDGGSTGAEAYGREVALLADAYSNQSVFRATEQEWRSTTRRPPIDTQRYFAGRLAPQGTAEAYATLMARLAQNGLSNAESSFLARRYLEWPNQFPANQDLFSNVGYKNGSLPGVLTTAYYAYRWNDVAPTVVILFYRDLPQQIYRQWRFDLPHDELARWLLADPAAISALGNALREASEP